MGNAIPASDRTVAGNDWEMPGGFRLELFHGNWCDAARIYRQWVFSEAAYRPRASVERTRRQRALGDIGLWLYDHSSPTDSMAEATSYLTGCAKYFSDFPLGIRWYRWNQLDFPGRRFRASCSTCLHMRNQYAVLSLRGERPPFTTCLVAICFSIEDSSLQRLI